MKKFLFLICAVLVGWFGFVQASGVIVGYSRTFGTPAITLTPDPTSWSPSCTEGDANATQTFTMTANNGSVTCNSPAGALTTGTDFFIDTDNCDGATVSQDANCTIDIHMPCDTAATPTDTLTVTSNASDSPKAISLSGTISAAGPSSPDLYIEFQQAWTPGSNYTPGGNDISPDSAITTSTDIQRSSSYYDTGLTYCALNPTADKGAFAVDISGKDWFDSSSGYLEFPVWSDFVGASNGLFEARVNTNNYLYLWFDDTGQFYAQHRHDNGSGSPVIVTNYDNTTLCTDLTKCRVAVRWDETLNKFDTKVANDGTFDTENWVETTDTDPIGAFNITGTPTEPTIGYIGAYNQSLGSDMYYGKFSAWNNYAQN